MSLSEEDALNYDLEFITFPPEVQCAIDQVSQVLPSQLHTIEKKVYSRKLSDTT